MHDIPALKALLDRHGVRLTRALGQNFLTADWVSAQTAEASGAEAGCGVLEVGPHGPALPPGVEGGVRGAGPDPLSRPGGDHGGFR